jgi:hypothetical protein
MLARATYEDLFEIVLERLDFLTSDDRDQVIGRNAFELFWASRSVKASDRSSQRGVRQA